VKYHYFHSFFTDSVKWKAEPHGSSFLASSASRVIRRSQRGALSVEHGVIRDRHMGDKCRRAAISASRDLELSVVHRVIGVRGGAISAECGVLRIRCKTLSVVDGVIRWQHGAQSEESGAIRAWNEAPSVEHRAIGVRCGA